MKVLMSDADQEIADFVRDRVKQYLQKNDFKYIQARVIYL